MTTADHRTSPRRRGDVLVRAILAATLTELRERGYAALTMDAVARRAGASKASLYRRWDSRAALVMDAVYELAPSPGQVPDTGDLRGDLLAALRQSAAVLEGPAGAALRGMLAEALPEPGRARELRARSRGTNRALMAEVLRRAVERGEIPPGAVTGPRLEVGAAMLRNHYLFHNEPLGENVLVGMVDDVLLPLCRAEPHRPPPPLPGSQPRPARPGVG
ncbi:TetR/AcrR family transcriptional regulator [Pseudactinotalea sp. HY158]|uniref:TetR/AcrR family transcriptional regulator n=1 Tax=Pseudactinotalea sp. HY158 TaxID=2654547 RepID=UPI00129C3A65|nr:TetR/AcrR family transcriptional regulator [Pseudactinotalea sp. HY158]QGH69773.1 TetR family transcriptional regulator [Pseudactinotalea sp. HY158]